MTDAAPSPDRPRRARSQHVLTVLRTERLTGHLVRVHLGGDGLDAFLAESDPERLAATDRYVKLLLPPRGSGLQPPFDLDALRASVAPEQLPVRRTYTVRSVDLERRSIAVDFVVHGDEGVAGPWALAAAPGDRIALSAPGGAWSPSADPEVVHLLLGDDSALPAIASALEEMPAHARGLVLIEVDSAVDELDLPAPAGVEVRWLHRGGLEAGRALVAAVRAEPRSEGVLEVFAHGERTAMKQLRALLQDAWSAGRSRSRPTGLSAAPRTASRPRSASRSARSSPTDAGAHSVRTPPGRD